MASITSGPVATRVLHCNLNTTDVEAAMRFYVEGLGLTERMRSVSEAGSSVGLGMDGPTKSIAAFGYDYRGGRVAPAVELVQWRQPATRGETYATPSEIGMQALGFAVASVDEARAACLAVGGTEVGARLSSTDPTVAVEAVLRDVDGVAVELVGDAEAPAGRLRAVRLSVADLGATTEWYRAIGFRLAGGPVAGRFESDDLAWNGDVTVQRLVPAAMENVELHLTEWEGVEPSGRAHELANTRGLFRMALGVDDVRAACEAATPPIVPGEPEYIPLPGTPLGGLWVAFMRDADGVMIEFVERPMDAPK